jgi:hypothetical protein
MSDPGQFASEFGCRYGKTMKILTAPKWLQVAVSVFSAAVRNGAMA